MNYHRRSPSSAAALPPVKTKHNILTSCFRPSVAGDESGSPESADGGPLIRPRARGHRSTMFCSGCYGSVAEPRRYHRRHHSADFHYDPMSYALNFDDGGGDAFSPHAPPGEARYKFLAAARVPASPPAPAPTRIGVVAGPGRREGSDFP